MARGEGSRARRNERARQQGRRDSHESAIPAQSVEVVSGQPYGSRKAQTEAQQAIPLPNAQGQQAADLAAALAAAQQTAPPDGGLAAPSSRPGEPVTAGLPTGPGPGPEAIQSGMGGLTDADLVRAAYRRFPTEAMRRLVERADREAGLDRMPMG